MPSQNLLKKIGSLKSAKYRQKYGQFTVEGRKGVDEVIHSSYEVISILASYEYAEKYTLPPNTELISTLEMKNISMFSTAPGLLALVKMINYEKSDLDLNVQITLCLDGISDPGNLGTIIRTADWFGIQQIVLSKDCPDFYNPKALSATMGSFTRCKFVYMDLMELLMDGNSVGCFLDGQDVMGFEFEAPLLLVIGSESHGIRENVEAFIKNRITIPGYGKAESLNVGVAAGIVLEKLSRSLKDKTL